MITAYSNVNCMTVIHLIRSKWRDKITQRFLAEIRVSYSMRFNRLVGIERFQHVIIMTSNCASAISVYN